MHKLFVEMTVVLSYWIYNILLTLIVIIVTYRLKNYIRAVFLALNLPGPLAYPIIGNALTVTNSKKMEYLGTNAFTLYGPLMRTWISIIPFIFVLDPSHLQTVLGNGKLTRKNMFYTLLHNFIGEGLITNNGEKWRSHRKLIQPYFHINALENFVTVFAETSSELVKRLAEVDEVKITEYINNWVLDTLHRAVLDIRITDEEYKHSPFRKGELIVPYRISRPWMLMDFIFKFTKSAHDEKKQKSSLHAFTKRVLDNKKKHGASTSTNFISLLDMFMTIAESNPSFEEKDIIDETCTFMLAGQDSVGAATAFSLYFLAKHQDVQAKVFKEQSNIFEDDSRLPNMQDLNEMKYLEQCIKETMRLCPSVPIVSRVLNEDVNLGEYTLPSGTNIFISPFVTHRMEYLYPEPLKYNPDRFSSENSSKIHPYGYIPFSSGPRNCIGYKFALLEIKCAISSIIRNYQIRLVRGKEELNLSYRITLRAKNGIWIKFMKRMNQKKLKDGDYGIITNFSTFAQNSRLDISIIY
ncbi:hypothetical protein HHI36_018636 [Cryptolaemus montrouzieri]|uniref:Cytochrome P450 n=1 Tax=Cryptolaemus montrouzieri TaxID=559131 RepID=A0ABD2P0Z8_9CUCU